MKEKLLCAITVLLLMGTAMAKELPEAPSPATSTTTASEFTASNPSSTAVVDNKPFSKTFISLSLISTSSTFADSYTTLFARQNWLAGKRGVCNIETQSPYLYGTHPTVGRAYAVASAKSVGSMFAAFYLRKHHSKFWAAPLIANSVISLEGVTQNMMTCN
jgi:hypothetical protein